VIEALSKNYTFRQDMIADALKFMYERRSKDKLVELFEWWVGKYAINVQMIPVTITDEFFNLVCEGGDEERYQRLLSDMHRKSSGLVGTFVLLDQMSEIVNSLAKADML